MRSRQPTSGADALPTCSGGPAWPLTAALLLLALPWRVAVAEVAEQDPAALCRTLEPLGVVTTGFRPPADGERPRCFALRREAAGRAPGAAHRYAVLAHWSGDHPHSAWLSVEDAAAAVVGRAPQARFLDMADRLLQALLTDPARRDVLAALQALRPGDTFWQMVEGMGIQARWVESGHGPADAFVVLRLDVADVCADLPRYGTARQACLAEYWLPDPLPPGARPD